MSNSVQLGGMSEVARLREAARRWVSAPASAPSFPHRAIAQTLRGRRGVAVIDQNISIGRAGSCSPRSPRPWSERGAAFALLRRRLGGGASPRRVRPDRCRPAPGASDGDGAGPRPHLLFTEQEHARSAAPRDRAGRKAVEKAMTTREIFKASRTSRGRSTSPRHRLCGGCGGLSRCAFSQGDRPERRVRQRRRLPDPAGRLPFSPSAVLFYTAMACARAGPGIRDALDS